MVFKYNGQGWKYLGMLHYEDEYDWDGVGINTYRFICPE